ncbi:retrovirus-related pol polyprotein from transposon TNT 1-94 [Tanacetum coccineum]
MLPNIPYLRKCRIVGKLLVDHAPSYDLTATADVPAMYLQQFWKTVKQVPNANEIIRFKIDKEEITYTVHMFHATLKLPVETPKQPFIPQATLEYIQPFLNIISYQGFVDKVSAFYTKNLAQPRQTMFKVFNRCITSRTSGHDQTKINILQIFHAVINKVHVDYANLLWWDFLHWMLNTNDLLTNAIRDKHIYKDYEDKYGGVDVPIIQPELVESTQGTNRTPRATRKPNPKDVQKRKRKGKQTAGESSTPKKLVEGEEEESDGTEFADLVLHSDEDVGDRLDLGSHKENPEMIDDDDETKDD